MQYLGFITQILSLAMLALSLIFMLGIIWRVEMKLDAAYKIIFVSLVFLFLSRTAELFLKNDIMATISQLGNFLFSILLLAGVWMTRNLFRNIDGETGKK